MFKYLTNLFNTPHISTVDNLLCMFKHEFNPENIMTEEIEEDILTTDEPSETIDHDTVNINSTFNKPYQIDTISNVKSMTLILQEKLTLMNTK